MGEETPRRTEFAALDGLLPTTLERFHGPAPKPPDDWDDGYVLPQHSEKPLQHVHHHQNDSKLVFYEQPHVYTYDGVPTSASVTALAHQYEKPFDPTAAIDGMKMSRSQAWPRVEYVEDARPLVSSDAEACTWTSERGALLTCDGKTVSVVQPYSLPPTATRDDMLRLLDASKLKNCPIADVATDADPTSDVHTYARERTPREIKDGWNRKGQLASHKGTEAHWLCECFLNGIPVRWWEPEMDIFFDFARRFLLPRGIVAYNTEKEIVCPRADLAGSIDAIFYEPSTGLHHIVDFKRSDKLKAQMRGFGKMTGELSHLDDCKGAAYALQTGVYQRILEDEYDMQIGERILLSIHPDQPFATSVPYLREEVDFLMRKRYALVDARKATRDAEPERFTCSLTGAPLVDAIRLVDFHGHPALAMEKAAQVRNLTYVAAHDVRAAFDAAVQAKMQPVEIHKANCMSWRRRMPEVGIVPFS